MLEKVLKLLHLETFRKAELRNLNLDTIPNHTTVFLGNGSIDTHKIWENERKGQSIFNKRCLYNMDEIGLFHRLGGDHSFTTKQLGR